MNISGTSDMADYVKNLITSDDDYDKNNWFTAKIGEEHYLLRIVEKENVYLISILSSSVQS